MKRYCGKLRIVGGHYKGRILHFPNIYELRPTPDRVRETLFNWLDLKIEGTRCLDLFAGSGALGIEAASRGAGEVVLVESNRHAAGAIKQNIEKNKIGEVSILHLYSINYLKDCDKIFDIIFLDPPYGSNLLEQAILMIDQNHLLKQNSWVYLEHLISTRLPFVPAHWSIHRKTRAGSVSACLFRVSNSS